MSARRLVGELETDRSGFVRLNMPWGRFRYRMRDPHRRFRSRSWRLREQRWQRVRRARMRYCLQRLHLHIVTQELEEAVAAGVIQRAEGGCYQALPAGAKPNPRKIAIQRMWLEGRSLRAIAAALDTTKGCLGPTMRRMRVEGWNLPLRHRMVDGRRVPA